LKRDEVFARDGHRCVYCGQPFPAEELTVDHVQPRVRGGDNTAGNVVTACGACNALKGHRRLADFLAAEPAVRANFFRLAKGRVYERHLRAVEEEIGARKRRDETGTGETSRG
jgi:5-methylcytosine-specific restriction endonuclease McrA